MRSRSLALAAGALMMLPAVAWAGAGPPRSWCGTVAPHARTQCVAAVRSFDGVLAHGNRPFQRAWRGHRDPGVSPAQDPSCPSQPGPESPCFAFYSEAGRYWFVSADVSRRQAARGQATIDGVFSYRHAWVSCGLGRGVRGRLIPGHIVSNNGCATGMPESDAYLVDVEMGAARGRVRFAARVGWQFTGSGSLDPSFLDAVGLYRCVRAAQITCRDGAGDVFRYIR